MQRAVRKRGADRRKKSRLTETLNCRRTPVYAAEMTLSLTPNGKLDAV